MDSFNDIFGHQLHCSGANDKTPGYDRDQSSKAMSMYRSPRIAETV